ncbi:MAG: glucokinase [Chloroflexi bacterium]|nr:glucokinase [Chloroflexota bacterium]
MVNRDLVLAGDVGGTKTQLAIFSLCRGLRAPLAEATLPSAAYANLSALAQQFLLQHRLPVERAVFGVAGPVRAGQATVTNLPWTLHEATLAAELGLSSVRLVNDLQAMASAIPVLQEGDLYPLQRGSPEPLGALAVIAPGTGLGQAFLTWGDDGYQAHPSEGGHAAFAPADALQIDLLRYLQSRYGHVSCERVCSGLGIPLLYAFLRERGAADEPPWLAQALGEAADPTPVIVSAAQQQTPPCLLCQQTLDLFTAILGTEAGNLALKVGATGGVYLGGGIPPRLLPHLAAGPFLQAFNGKGRFRDYLAAVPLWVITYRQAGLLGAACLGLGAQRLPAAAETGGHRKG